MTHRSFLFTDTRPAARMLVQKADQALVNGDRESVAEFVSRLYNLYDWQMSLTSWPGPTNRPATRRRIYPATLFKH